ncbi:MAG: acetate--CoA ligase family protein [Pseudomonadota bacterium]
MQKPGTTDQDLSALDAQVFAPRAVALIGLSSRADAPTGRPLQFLRRAGYSGKIHVVNPARETVQGERCLTSIHDAPEVPEHAYILVGQDRVEQAVHDCAEAGVKIASILADGFGEAGSEGLARQNRLVDIARSAGMRLLGPNSMGVADLHLGSLITVNAIYQEQDLPTGPVSLISQSGSMMGGLISRAKALGIGYARTAAVGNECDLGVPELGRMMLADPNTEVIALFLETIRDADGLAGFAAAAHDADKPVIAYKLGRSALGQEMAVAHTGALLAEDSVTDAFLRDIGIARVTSLDALVEAPMLFRGRTPLGLSAPSIGVITTTGGGGATVCDRLALEGISVAPPSANVLQTVRDTGLSVVPGPMLDLTMAGAGPDFVKPAIEAVASEETVDLVLSITGSSGRSSPERTIPPLVEADAQGKPLVSFMVPDALESLKGVIAGGLPGFRTPEACADAIGAFCRWRAPRITQIARLPEAGIPRVLDEHRSLRLLQSAGVLIPQTIRCRPGDRPDLPFPYPIVAKVLSEDVPHKTDAGGVELGIRNSEELSEATLRIKANVERHHPEVTVDEILIAPMIDTLQEVLIGYKLDPSVGPVVTLAPGGILVGLYDDKTIRCAPVDRATARTMIDEVKGLAPIRGHRGLPKGDLDALADAIVAISGLIDHQPTVLEAEANPVMVQRQGVVAVDALVTLAGESKR